MPTTTTPQPFSDSFWPTSYRNTIYSTSIYKKEHEENLVDDTSEFYDPFSELNLFLAKHIQPFFAQTPSPYPWTRSLQETLIAHIAPLFRQRFPHDCLSICALKTLWEKKRDYAEITSLTPSLFIRSRLKHDLHPSLSPSVHPYHFTGDLAMKTAEYIAIVNGEKLDVTRLGKQIWSLQRHLLIGFRSRSPYDEYEEIDKRIVQLILQKTSSKEEIQQELSCEAERVERWLQQADLIYGLITLESSPLLQQIIDAYKTLNTPLAPSLFIKYFTSKWGYSSDDSPIWMNYKYAWYRLFIHKDESTYDRFLKWHALSLQAQSPALSQEALIAQLRALTEKHLPLIPFDEGRGLRALTNP